MNFNYIEFNFIIKPLNPATEILIAELGFLGFDSFIENEIGLQAYILEDQFSDNILNDVNILKRDEFNITYSSKKIEQTNWNKEWESNFNPIIVDDTCIIKAPFHQIDKSFKYEIIIEPKMSFGTGHHETTYMMIQHILENDFTNKSVLDMGCGTAILAILTEFKKAKRIDAIDFDNWCYLNSLENIQKNSCKNISVYEGDVRLIENNDYDIIIANINRNVLLSDIKQYTKSLKKGGLLFLSGFYQEDFGLIESKCTKNDLEFVKKFEKNNWIATKFIKK